MQKNHVKSIMVYGEGIYHLTLFLVGGARGLLKNFFCVFSTLWI